MPSRQNINSSIKAQVVQQLKAGKITMDAVVDKYKVQPYQVYAWVGQGMLKGEVTPQTVPAQTVQPQSVEVRQQATDQVSRPTLSNTIERLSLTEVSQHSSIDPELARLVGEWWLRERLPRRLAGNS